MIRDTDPNVDRVLCAAELYAEGQSKAAHLIVDAMVGAVAYDLLPIVHKLEDLAELGQRIHVLREFGTREYMEQFLDEDDWPRADFAGFREDELCSLEMDAEAARDQILTLARGIAVHACTVERAA